MFSFRILWFHILHLSLLSFKIYFCIRCEKVIQFDYFACNSPVVPVPYIEEAVFSPLYILASFVMDFFLVAALEFAIYIHNESKSTFK